MSAGQFKVIFTGNLQAGTDPQVVAQQLSKRFKIPVEKAAKIIDAQREILLKASVAHEKAFQMKAALKSIGMLVRLEMVSIVAPAKAAVPATKKDEPTDQAADAQASMFGAKDPSLKPEESVGKPEYTPTTVSTPFSDYRQGPSANVRPPPRSRAKTGSGKGILGVLGTILFVIVIARKVFDISIFNLLFDTRFIGNLSADEVCFFNAECTARVEDQMDVCWNKAEMDSYDIDAMSDAEYERLWPTLERGYFSCFVDGSGQRLLLDPFDLHFELLDNCFQSDDGRCFDYVWAQREQCYSQNRMSAYVDYDRDLLEVMAENKSAYKRFYGCFLDDKGNQLFEYIVSNWDDIYE